MKKSPFVRMSNQDGFTLHEVLVAIVISSLLIGFGLSVFLFAQKFLIAREQTLNLRSVVDQTLQALSSDIERSCGLEGISDSTLVVRLPNQRVVTYRFDGSSIQRNGLPMHQEATRVSVAIAEANERPGSTRRQRALRIRIAAESGNARYQAETVALLPWSARQEFSTTSSRVF